MSLRRKDDWDIALEEAALRKGKVYPKPFTPPPEYDYGVRFVFTKKELEKVQKYER